MNHPDRIDWYLMRIAQTVKRSVGSNAQLDEFRIDFPTKKPLPQQSSAEAEKVWGAILASGQRGKK